MEKIKPSEKIRKEIDEILEDGVERGDNLMDSFLRLGARLLIQELLEKEVTEFLERGWYERHRGEGLTGVTGMVMSPRL